MNVCMLLEQLIECEKDIRAAKENLRIIQEQFMFRIEMVAPKGFWELLRNSNLYDRETFNATNVFTGNMDSFIHDAGKGFFSDDQVKRVFLPWQLSIECFVATREKQKEIVEKQIKENYKEFIVKNPEVKINQETFINYLLKFMAS